MRMIFLILLFTILSGCVTRNELTSFKSELVTLMEYNEELHKREETIRNHINMYLGGVAAETNYVNQAVVFSVEITKEQVGMVIGKMLIRVLVVGKDENPRVIEREFIAELQMGLVTGLTLSEGIFE